MAGALSTLRAIGVADGPLARIGVTEATSLSEFWARAGHAVILYRTAYHARVPDGLILLALHEIVESSVPRDYQLVNEILGFVTPWVLGEVDPTVVGTTIGRAMYEHPSTKGVESSALTAALAVAAACLHATHSCESGFRSGCEAIKAAASCRVLLAQSAGDIDPKFVARAANREFALMIRDMIPFETVATSWLRVLDESDGIPAA